MTKLISELPAGTPAASHPLEYQDLTDLTDGADGTSKKVTANHFATSSDLTSHTGNASIHFTEASIDHGNIQNVGANTHLQIDAHISDLANPHVTSVGSLSDTIITGPLENQDLLQWNGTHWVDRTLAQAGIASSSDLSAHTGDNSIHFTEGSIDHVNIQNIGTNSHAQIDTHLADQIQTGQPHGLKNTGDGTQVLSDNGQYVPLAVAGKLKLTSLFPQLWSIVNAADGSGIDTGSQNHRLIFAESLDGRLLFSNIHVAEYGGGDLTANLIVSMQSATAGNVRLFLEFWAISPGDSADTDTPVWGTRCEAEVAVPGTANYPFSVTISCPVANLSGLAAGDLLSIQLGRLGTHGGDTAADECWVRSIVLTEA